MISRNSEGKTHVAASKGTGKKKKKTHPLGIVFTRIVLLHRTHVAKHTRRSSVFFEVKTQHKVTAPRQKALGNAH